MEKTNQKKPRPITDQSGQQKMQEGNNDSFQGRLPGGYEVDEENPSFAEDVPDDLADDVQDERVAEDVPDDLPDDEQDERVAEDVPDDLANDVAANAAGIAAADAVDDVWISYIQDNLDIGLVTLFCYHQSTNNNNCRYCKPLLLLALAIQIMVPYLLLINDIVDVVEFEFCPGKDDKANIMQKLLAMCAAIINFLSLSLRMQRLLRQEWEQRNRIIPLSTNHNGGILQHTVSLDRIFFFVHVPIVYLINLFHIFFIELDSYTIIINALALQIISELNVWLKLEFIENFPPDLDQYRRVNNENQNRETVVNQWCHQFFNLTSYMNFKVMLFSSFVALICTIYFPLCKPTHHE